MTHFSKNENFLNFIKKTRVKNNKRKINSRKLNNYRTQRSKFRTFYCNTTYILVTALGAAALQFLSDFHWLEIPLKSKLVFKGIL